MVVQCAAVWTERRRTADAAQEREFVVRCPGADHKTVNAQRGHGKDVKDADVEISNLKIDHPLANLKNVAEGDDRKSYQGRE